MNRLFNTFFDAPTTAGRGAALRRWIPAMDLVETDGEFVLRADLPGLSERRQHKLEDNVLTVSGERESGGATRALLVSSGASAPLPRHW